MSMKRMLVGKAETKKRMGLHPQVVPRPQVVPWVAAALFGCLVQALPANGANATTPQEKITATISPEVREQLQKLEPGERKKMEAAIFIGNKYAPHHFDGTAYARNDELEEKIWQKNIRPLVTLQANRENGGWYFPGGVFVDSTPDLKINGTKVVFAVVCPRPDLISVRAVTDHSELKYRTKIIGVWKSSSKLHPIEGDIVRDEREEFDEVLLAIDKNNKVSQVVSKYAVLSDIPQRGIDKFEAYIKWPPRAIFQGSNGVEQESESEARAKIPQYKKYIELIKSEEAAACGGASGNSNQNQGRK